MASIRKTNFGTWQVRYRDPNGRGRARNFARKTDATRFAHAVETDKVRGDWLDPRLAKVTFGEWAEEWLAQAANLKPKTRHDYERTLRNHVLPVFGETPVGAIDRMDMRRFAAALMERGIGASTLHAAVKVARLVLGVAVDGGAIKANPAMQLRLPRPSKTEMHFLTPEQVESLARGITQAYATLVRFAAYTGLRAGEIGALRVGRLDLLRGWVEVAESMAEVNGKLIFGATKTYANRHVPLPPFLRDELAAYLAGRPHDPGALVFTAPQGGALRHNLFYRRHYKPAAAAVGLPADLRFHDLRHSYAAFCIASTADPYAVMRRMGHSSITVTYNTYGHLFPERDQEITTGLEELFHRADVDFSWTPPAQPGKVRALR
jgi:integrase